MVSDVVVEVLFIIGEYILSPIFDPCDPLDLSLSLHPIDEILVQTVILLDHSRILYFLKK